MLFYRDYETLPQHLCNSSDCKDCYTNTNALTYKHKQFNCNFQVYLGLFGGQLKLRCLRKPLQVAEEEL